MKKKRKLEKELVARLDDILFSLFIDDTSMDDTNYVEISNYCLDIFPYQEHVNEDFHMHYPGVLIDFGDIDRMERRAILVTQLLDIYKSHGIDTDELETKLENLGLWKRQK